MDLLKILHPTLTAGGGEQNGLWGLVKEQGYGDGIGMGVADGRSTGIGLRDSGVLPHLPQVNDPLSTAEVSPRSRRITHYIT